MHRHTGARTRSVIRHELVSFRRDDGEGLKPSALGIFPCIPQTGKSERIPVRQLEGVRLLWRLPLLRPFIEGIRRDQTASFPDRLTPGLCRSDRLGARVDRRKSLDGFQIVREERNKALPRQD